MLREEEALGARYPFWLWALWVYVFTDTDREIYLVFVCVCSFTDVCVSLMCVFTARDLRSH